MIIPIVEGQSEQESIPLLIRRIFEGRGIYGIAIRKGFRVHRDRFVKENEVERSVEFARRQPGVRAIAVVVDADDDCPKELGASLLARGVPVAANCLMSVVLAKMEMEAWFIAGIESLRGIRGVREDVVRPEDPESIRGAKAWLTRNMREGFTYVPVDDQPALVQQFDYVSAASHSRSLRKFIRDVEQIGMALQTRPQE